MLFSSPPLLRFPGDGHGPKCTQLGSRKKEGERILVGTSTQFTAICRHIGRYCWGKRRIHSQSAEIASFFSSFTNTFLYISFFVLVGGDVQDLRALARHTPLFDDETNKRLCTRVMEVYTRANRETRARRIDNTALRSTTPLFTVYTLSFLLERKRERWIDGRCGNTASSRYCTFSEN